MLVVNKLDDPTPEELEEHFTTYPESSTSCHLNFINSDCAMPAESIAAFQHLPEKINTLSLGIGCHSGKSYPSSEIAKEYLLIALRAASLTKVTKLICRNYLFQGLSLEDVKDVFNHMPPNVQEISFELNPFGNFNTNELAELSEALPRIVKFSRTERALANCTPYAPSVETLDYYQTLRIKKCYDELQGSHHFRDEPGLVILEYAGFLPPEHKKLFQQMPLQKMLIDIGFDRLLEQLYDRSGDYDSTNQLDLVGPAFNSAIENTCHALNKAKILFLTSDELIENKKRLFKSQCPQIINDDCEGVLGQHRGFKIVLDGLFKIICAIFSPNVNGLFFTLFRPQTNSEKLARKLDDATQKKIEDIEQPQEEPLSPNQ